MDINLFRHPPTLFGKHNILTVTSALKCYSNIHSFQDMESKRKISNCEPCRAVRSNTPRATSRLSFRAAACKLDRNDFVKARTRVSDSRN